tara:strand:+ start:3927 stop:6212 length:2286 start_codon:yes stop_codon:yes gene_type:complete
MANELNRRNDTLRGAMLENNMYAWVATGAGRLDLSNDVDLTFSYVDYVVKDKTRIKNPQAHIQFACDSRGIRNLYSKDGWVKRDDAIPVAVSTLVKDYQTISGDTGSTSGQGVLSTSEKYFLKPRIDEFKLVSKVVRDMNANGSGVNDITDISYHRIKFDTIKLWSGDKASGGLFNNKNDASTFSWRILDLCNNAVDGSYNVIAAGKLHCKYNIDASDDVWPSGLDVDNSYTLHGFGITPRTRARKDISFSFQVGTGVSGEGLEGGSTDSAPKYVVNTTYGSIVGMKFNLGRPHSDMSLAFPDSSGWVCTFVSDTGANIEASFVEIGNRFDLSYVRDTLSDPSYLDLNSDNYLGDVILDVSGSTGEDCGLKCVHVPDSLHGLRNDAAASLAANFVGLTELMGDLSYSQLDPITPANINTLATASVAGASSGMDGSMGEIAAVYTISGDILSNKLKNFMLGKLDSNGNSTLTGNARFEHIHKAVYSASGEMIDASNASVARYNNAKFDADGNFTGDFTDCSGEIRELTPQESAFFYYYPWASTYMCCSGSSVASEVLESSANPFRQWQSEFLEKTYNEALDMSGIRAVVPTVEGWMDSTHGVYDVANNRTEWYSFVDICANNNINNVQINDISYIYQDLDASCGNYQLCPLEIVFPDVSAGAVADASGNTNRLDDDFCTLNFQIPLKSSNPAGQKRLDKVANLNNGLIQLTNDYVQLTDGFTAKCHATASKIGNISTNNTELMNAYMPVIVRLVGQRDAELA